MTLSNPRCDTSRLTFPLCQHVLNVALLSYPTVIARVLWIWTLAPRRSDRMLLLASCRVCVRVGKHPVSELWNSDPRRCCWVICRSQPQITSVTLRSVFLWGDDMFMAIPLTLVLFPGVKDGQFTVLQLVEALGWAVNLLSNSTHTHD